MGLGSDILDISAEDVRGLSDDYLRSLVARLAEATLLKQGLSAAYVTWGGDQNAPDGGLDVQVSCQASESPEGFIPRRKTGFQVKKPKMNPAKIVAEMRPGGSLRPVITELAANGGAYIIVSSGSSLSHTALKRRTDAMLNAVSDAIGCDQLFVDFYDSQRLASWLRDFPGLIPGVRAKAGRVIQGWQPLGRWSDGGEGPASVFLTEDQARLFEDGGNRTSGERVGLSVVEGLSRLRSKLSKEGCCLRLIGLSGVGKTRFAEALFDSNLGEFPLSTSKALYTDLADQPEPAPISMATHLVQSGTQAILIIDNCPPELHGQLAKICGNDNSTVNTMTIEYDIREDQPERTDVFRLEAASPDLVSKLVLTRYPEISTVDAKTIGEFSGGNARIGLALADTLERGESLAGLTNELLFQRLFRQRHVDVPGLLAAAEACALVYSFNADPLEGEEAELPCLAEMAGCSVRDLHAHAAELTRRGLMQARGRWRAILPHAIANRLARRALENLPRSEVPDRFSQIAPDRLLQSFARRIGYLHDSVAAVQIADEWLSKNGLLADIANLDNVKLAMLRGIAPASPKSVVAALRRVGDDPAHDLFSTANSQRYEIAGILRLIAYDPDLFDASTDLLTSYAEAEEEDCRSNRILDTFTSLFYPFLSGTLAPVEQRLRKVRQLLQSPVLKRQVLGKRVLEAVLKADRFNSVSSFQFGARSRGFGYEPRTVQAQTDWFSAGIRLAVDVGTSKASSADIVRTMFATVMPGLWLYTMTHSLIEEAATRFRSIEFWQDGWAATRETLWRLSGSGNADSRARMELLERRLAPHSLFEKVEVYVLRDRHLSLETDETVADIRVATDRADQHAQELGRRVGSDRDLFGLIAPKLLLIGNGQRYQFGRGLADATPDLTLVWRQLLEACDAFEGPVNPLVFIGFLERWKTSDAAAVDDALDTSMVYPGLAAVFPQIQIAVGLDRPGICRLLHSLRTHLAPPAAFRVLSFGRVTERVPPDDIRDILLALAVQPTGLRVCVEVLARSFRSDFRDGTEKAAIEDIGRAVLSLVDTNLIQGADSDRDLSTLVMSCLGGDNGKHCKGSCHRNCIENASFRDLSIRAPLSPSCTLSSTTSCGIRQFPSRQSLFNQSFTHFKYLRRRRSPPDVPP